MRGELDALQERAEGAAGWARSSAAAGWRALLDGIDAPDEAWPAVEAIVGGELEQALLWQDDELAASAGGRARLGTAAGRRKPRRGGPRMPRGRMRWLPSARIGRWRTGSAASGCPVLFRWTALLPDVETLLGTWRVCPPAGWR